MKPYKYLFNNDVQFLEILPRIRASASVWRQSFETEVYSPDAYQWRKYEGNRWNLTAELQTLWKWAICKHNELFHHSQSDCFSKSGCTETVVTLLHPIELFVADYILFFRCRHVFPGGLSHYVHLTGKNV